MSTKTLHKRIALVAVSALGFGLLGSVSANAAAIANGDAIVQLKLNSFTNTATTIAARVNNEVSIAVTATGSAAASAANQIPGSQWTSTPKY
jgi:hypothetical protein